MSSLNLLKQYQPLFDLNVKTRYFNIFGGRGGSKSFHVALSAILNTYKNISTFSTRYIMSNIPTTIMPEYLEKIELINKQADFYITQDTILNKKTNSKITFSGIKTASGQQTAKTKGLKGYTHFIIDEAEELSLNDFIKLDDSFRKANTNSRIILVYNPQSKKHWLYDKFFSDNGINNGFNGIYDNTTYIYTSYLDNLHNLEQSFINNAEKAKLKDLEFYNNNYLGFWKDIDSSVIFKNTEKGIYNNNTHLTQYVGLDFGFSDPTAAVLECYDKKINTIYCKELFYQSQATINDIYNALSVYKNLTIIADNASPILINELRNKGLRIVPCVKDKVLDSTEAMAQNKIVYEGKNIGRELELHKKDSIGNIIDSNNHSIDAIRYVYIYIKKAASGVVVSSVVKR